MAGAGIAAGVCQRDQRAQPRHGDMRAGDMAQRGFDPRHHQQCRLGRRHAIVPTVEQRQVDLPFDPRQGLCYGGLCQVDRLRGGIDRPKFGDFRDGGEVPQVELPDDHGDHLSEN